MSTKKKIDKEISGIYEWIKHIQSMVKFHSYHNKDEKYDRTVNCWVFGVIDYINKAKSSKPEFNDLEKDGVLATANMVGTFFLSWYFRTHLAKAYDPRRELKGRKTALRQVQETKDRIMRIMEMEPNNEDKKIYDQEWEKPI